MTDTTEQRVHKIVVAHLGANPAALRNEQTILGDLSGDQLDVLELVMAIEDEFGFEIPDDMIGEAGDDKITVGAFVDIAVKLSGETANV